jgi:hypothetical protein
VLAEDAESKRRDASYSLRQQALATVRQLKRELRQERKAKRRA